MNIPWHYASYVLRVEPPRNGIYLPDWMEIDNNEELKLHKWKEKEVNHFVCDDCWTHLRVTRRYLDNFKNPMLCFFSNNKDCLTNQMKRACE